MKKLFLFLIFAISCNSLFANITQGKWRWRNNDGNLQTATWKAAQNTAITVNDQQPIRLRVEIYNDTNDSTKSIPGVLQYATSTNGPWYDISDNSPVNAFVFAGDNYYVSDKEVVNNKLLTSTKYATFEPGIVTTTGNTVGRVIKFNKSYEFEWNIKATPNALPNTTYYFKTDNTEGGGGSYPHVTTGSSFAAKNFILANGGFETTQQTWVPTIPQGTAATIAVNTTANQVHSGSKALKVTVTNAGAANSVKVTHTGFQANSERTYLLRFWAISDLNNADLRINLKSGATDNTCAYKISQRFDASGNGWQLYEYPFKAPTGTVSLEIAFNSNATYYLDDVEIFDDLKDIGVDVVTQYKWWNNHPNPGWISGDNDTSIKLPDGRTAWIFSDSFMGANDSHTNVMTTNRIINNLVVVEDKGQFSYKIQGTPGNAGSLFGPIGGRVLWNSGAVVDGNEVKVVLDQVDGLNTAGTYIGTLSLPDLQIVGTPEKSFRPISALMQDGEYIYIYYGESVGTFERYTKVARVKNGQLHSQIPWEFYTNAGKWDVNGEADAKRLVSGSVATHVMKLGPGNYVMNAVPNLRNEIAVWFAASPEGPWVNKTIVYNIPDREKVLAYFGHIDAGTGKDGMYTFTYSTYPFIDDPVPMQRRDKGVYTIKYAKANLLELSPFTPKKQPDSLVSYSANTAGKNIIVKWTTALTGHDHFEVQLSRDLSTWTTVANVAGGDGNSYKAEFAAPAPGVVYFRLKIFDADKNLTTKNPIRYNIVPNAVLASAGVTKDGDRARINFATGLQTFNPGFRIGKSKTLTPDVSSWTVLKDVPGAGTKGGVIPYQLYDDAPGVGTTYYGIAYYKNGVETYAYLGSVNFSAPQAAKTNAFSVYPNPASSNIKFELAGYKGKSLTATVSNLSGKVMGKETLTVNDSGTYTLRTRPAAGIYILNVNGSGLSKSARVILE